MFPPKIELDWWPPIHEAIGEERAVDLVAELQRISGPVVADAERDLRRRIDSGVEIIRSGAPATYLARCRFDDPQVQSLCVGTVYQAKGNPAAMNSIQLGRDGVLRWRRERSDS